MGQLIVAAAGAALGASIPGFGIAALGMSGGQLGWMVGSALGGMMFQQNAPSTNQHFEGAKLADLRVTGTEYGQPIPWAQGTPRLAGQIWWASDKRQIAHTTTTTSGGGGGGKGGGDSGGGQQTTTQTTYTYDVDLLIGLTDNLIESITRIWSDGKLVYSIGAGTNPASVDASQNTEQWDRLTIYTGHPSQLPDPTYEAAVTTAKACAYRGRGSVFIQSLHLGSGGFIPNLTFEVVVNVPTPMILSMNASVPGVGVASAAVWQAPMSGAASLTLDASVPSVSVATAVI